MMLQVTHTYPAGAYKKPLAFLILELNPDVLTIKISPSFFVGSTSWIVESRCTYDQDKPKPFCRLYQLDSWIVETRCTYDQDKPKPFCRLQLLGFRSCLTNHHAEVFFPQEPVRRQVIPNLCALEQVSFLSNAHYKMHSAIFELMSYHIWLSTRMRLQNAFSNFWVDVISYHIHFWFNVLRPYKKPWVFAKQRVYKTIRVTLLQKGGPTTNFNYKKIPRPFYTIHVFSLSVVEIPSGIVKAAWMVAVLACVGGQSKVFAGTTNPFCTDLGGSFWPFPVMCYWNVSTSHPYKITYESRWTTMNPLKPLFDCRKPIKSTPPKERLGDSNVSMM